MVSLNLSRSASIFAKSGLGKTLSSLKGNFSRLKSIGVPAQSPAQRLRPNTSISSLKPSQAVFKSFPFANPVSYQQDPRFSSSTVADTGAKQASSKSRVGGPAFNKALKQLGQENTAKKENDAALKNLETRLAALNNRSAKTTVADTGVKQASPKSRVGGPAFNKALKQLGQENTTKKENDAALKNLEARLAALKT